MATGPRLHGAPSGGSDRVMSGPDRRERSPDARHAPARERTKPFPRRKGLRHSARALRSPFQTGGQRVSPLTLTALRPWVGSGRSQRSETVLEYPNDVRGNRNLPTGWASGGRPAPRRGYLLLVNAVTWAALNGVRDPAIRCERSGRRRDSHGQDAPPGPAATDRRRTRRKEPG